MKKLILSVFALAAIVLSVNAQATYQENTATADAVLQAGITVSGPSSGAATALGGAGFADGALNFGTIAIGSTGTSVVTVAASDGARTSTGDAILNGGTVSAAAFKVTGADLPYTVSLPSSITIASTAVGSTPLTVDNFVTNLVSNSTTISGGLSYFAVGAKLNIPSSSKAGAYTGTFLVSVDYN